MSLTGTFEQAERDRTRNGAKQQRGYVLYLADQVNLAVFHKRPNYEIDNLMDRLRVAVERKDN